MKQYACYDSRKGYIWNHCFTVKFPVGDHVEEFSFPWKMIGDRVFEIFFRISALKRVLEEHQNVGEYFFMCDGCGYNVSVSPIARF